MEEGGGAVPELYVYIRVDHGKQNMKCKKIRTSSYWYPALCKIRGISSKKKKIQFIRGGKVGKMVVGNGSSYCSNFFHFDVIGKIKKLWSKILILNIFSNIVTNCMFFGTTASFRFHLNKKNGTVTWTISNNFFLPSFLPLMNLIFYFVRQRAGYQ